GDLARAVAHIDVGRQPKPNMPPAAGDAFDSGRQRAMPGLELGRLSFGVESVSIDDKNSANGAARDANVVSRIERPKMGNNVAVFCGVQNAAPTSRHLALRLTGKDGDLFSDESKRSIEQRGHVFSFR